MHAVQNTPCKKLFHLHLNTDEKLGKSTLTSQQQFRELSCNINAHCCFVRGRFNCLTLERITLLFPEA